MFLQGVNLMKLWRLPLALAVAPLTATYRIPHSINHRWEMACGILIYCLGGIFP